MEASILDIEDLVRLTVYDLTHPIGKPVPIVQISGDNILIGDTPVTIIDIMAQRHSCKGFLTLIKGAL